MSEKKPNKKPRRIRPVINVTLNPKNLEAAKKYENATGKRLSNLLDDLMEEHFLKKGYLPKTKPREP